MIKVYIIDNARVLPRNDFLHHLNTLPVEMKIKASGFSRWEDAQAYLMGKFLLKRALADFNLRSNLNDVKYTRHGRPYLENIFDFNISHSGRYVVCAICTYGRVGIDIEEVKPVLIHEFRPQFVDEEWKSIINAENTGRQKKRSSKPTVEV
jgi:4'-phosphopantetheinyl transferase